MDKHKAAIFRLFEQGAFPKEAFSITRVLDGRKIIVYGAGECCHWFVEVAMRMRGYIPAVVLDRGFTCGDTYEGIPGFSPLDYYPTDEEKREGIVVICVGKQALHEEILGTIKGLGFQNIIFLMDVYDIHNPFGLPGELEEKGFSFFQEQEDRIFACLELFEDESSREIYTRCLQTHMRRKPVPLPARPREEQYFPKDIELSQGYSRFVCCGTDTGDMDRLKEVCGKVDAITSFEPDPAMFLIVSEYLRKHKDELAENIVAMPCALYSQDSLMPFTSANREEVKRSHHTGFGSRILAHGESMIQCVTLDRALPWFKATFICMDTEGAEFEVLKGGERLIRANRPDLAICVYHAPHHLWEIPLYLHSLGLGYRLYLRNYTTFTSETVLYATM